MGFIPSKRLIIGIFLLFILFSGSRAQAVWEIGVKGGTNFYLGDLNSTIFNGIQPLVGGFVRYNKNPRWDSKLQLVSAEIKTPIKQNYVDLSVQEEFNFFEYGLLNSDSWTRFFSPYIFVGLGAVSFTDSNDKVVFAPNVPFGLGVKWKVFRRINIGLEWSLHKLFTDKFDYVDNPYNANASIFTNNDWYSMGALMVGIDLGDRSRYCR